MTGYDNRECKPLTINVDSLAQRRLVRIARMKTAIAREFKSFDVYQGGEAGDFISLQRRYIN